MSSAFTYGLLRPPSRPLPLLSYPRLVSCIFSWMFLPCAVVLRPRPYSAFTRTVFQVIRAVSEAWYGSSFGERLLIHISYSPRRYILLRLPFVSLIHFLNFYHDIKKIGWFFLLHLLKCHDFLSTQRNNIGLRNVFLYLHFCLQRKCSVGYYRYVSCEFQIVADGPVAYVILHQEACGHVISNTANYWPLFKLSDAHTILR